MGDYQDKITVDKRLRPLRLAFLVRLSDPAAVMRAFESNTCLWGGMYNGIIPCFDRVPKWWTTDRFAIPSPKEVIQGYLNAFEPDFVVYTDPALKSKVDLPRWQVISIDDVFQGDEDREVKYGLPVTTYYKHLYKEEFKFQRKEPVPFYLPKKGSRGTWDGFAAAVSGCYPSRKPFSTYQSLYQRLFEPEEVTLSRENLLEVDRGLSPLSVGSFRLEMSPRGWLADPTFFLMNPMRLQDLVDYWNLRALGWTIWPVPIQWSRDIAEACQTIARQIHRPYKHNPDMMHATAVMKSRSVDKDALKSFYSAVNFRSPKDGHGAVTMQPWFPRIWDDWARDPDHVVRPNLDWEKAQEEVSITDRHLSFSMVSPGFVKEYGYGSIPRWANVLSFRHFSDTGEYPTCFPEDIGDCRFLFRGLGFHETTVTSEGITVRCTRPRETEYCEYPTSDELVKAWLHSRGIEMKVTSAGTTTRELIRMVGGPRGACLFNREEIVQLFHKMATGMVEDDTETPDRRRPKSRAKLEGPFFGALKKCNTRLPDAAEYHMRALLRSKIIRVGSLITCAKCGQRNWYALDDLKDILRCERCLEEFPFPAEHPGRECSWAYRVQGPFATEGFAHGAYTVALLLRALLDEFHFENSSWLSGVEMTWGGKSVESDLLGFFRRDPRFRHGRMWTFLAECKSFGRFEKTDFDRAKTLMEKFPGAVFCFATLKSGLEDKEKKAIAKLALWGRKTLSTERWRNPLMVLTGRELFHEISVGQAWTDAGGKFARLISYYGDENDVQWFAQATQMAYLDLPSWHQQIQEKCRRTRRGRASK